MTISVSNLNELSDEEFATLLGDVAEHSPWVMERVATLRPFKSVRGLHQAVTKVLADASERDQTSLICAHPDLAGKAARAGDMTEASVSEQSCAGLDQLTDKEFEQFERLNDVYQSKFGFPFIIAVKGHDKKSILAAFEERLENDEASELRAALDQIAEIIRYRLEDMVIHDE